MSRKHERVFDFWEVMLVGLVLAAIAYSFTYGVE